MSAWDRFWCSKGQHERALSERVIVKRGTFRAAWCAACVDYAPKPGRPSKERYEPDEVDARIPPEILDAFMDAIEDVDG